jgi:glycosyltransferase involved in cell wall biosynthesis
MADLRVLIVHNRYQRPGGEDSEMEAEAQLLEELGATVERLEVHNDAVNGLGKMELLGKTLWNREAARDAFALASKFRPHVAHVHNTLPLLSPAIFPALRRAGAATVLSLHNFRLVCPGAYLLRDGRVCESCLGRRFALPGIRHGCYRGSRATTAAVAATTALHHAAGTWTREVDRFIALTEFARGLFVRGGLPEARISVKPNFVPSDPGPGPGGQGALFVGRLSEEKGVRTLVDAWHRLPDLPLTVIGDGPLAQELRAAAPGNVRFLGWMAQEEVHVAMRAADLLVFPSLWYEGLPITLIEAAAAGLPAVVSQLGAQAEIVAHGETGWHVPAGDAEALAARVRSAMGDPDELRRMRVGTRRRFESLYTADAQRRHLLGVYREALVQRHGVAPDVLEAVEHADGREQPVLA